MIRSICLLIIYSKQGILLGIYPLAINILDSVFYNPFDNQVRDILFRYSNHIHPRTLVKFKNPEFGKV